MATAREESNPYDGGLGTGGKFRKRPFRRSQTTPYDRPPTAIRNPSHSNSNNRNNDWLSKLMDPTQRLITSCAHRLFASVFRKRIPPPPPPPRPLEPDANQKVRDEGHEADTTLPAKNPPVIQEGEINECDNASNRSSKDGLTELEQILGQKTFTRSEIGRLTTLLRSRTVDTSVGNEEKRSEVIPSKSVVAHHRKEEIRNTPIQGNGIQSHFISTPLVGSSVLDEDIASPAELARAYMGGRPSKVSPSMLGLRSQVVREDSIILNNRPFPPKSPMISLVPRSSGHVGVPENGFITPRSRGRSVIYSMARTPYSTVLSTANVKGAGPTTEVFGGPSSSSSSQSAWEQNRLSGSKQGALKRRSSVFDNGIGSVGPIRRIRQKPNLLSSKNLSLPASGSPLSVHAIASGSDAQSPSSSKQKPVILGEVKHSFAKTSTENADNIIPGSSSFTSFTPVPSKSSEMASKILEQLDKLISSREKSPTKLSPSMLHGLALKSLENVDSSKFLENLQYNVKPRGSLDPLLPDGRESTSQKQDKVEENGPTKSFPPRDKSAPVMNGVDATGLMKDNVPNVNATGSPVVNYVAHPPPQKKRAFRMSAHEDYLDLDDDDYSNGAAYNPLDGGREELDTSMMGNNTIVSEAVKVEAPPSLSEVKPLESSVLNRKADNGTSDGSVDAGKSIRITSTAASASMTVQTAMVITEPISTFGKAASPNKSNNTALFSFGETSKEPNGASMSCNFGVRNDDEALLFASASSSSVVSESLGLKFGVSSDPKPEMQSSFAAGAVGSLPKAFDSDKVVINNALKSGLISPAVLTSPTGSIISFGAATNNSSLNNGFLATSPSSFSSLFPPLVSNNVTSQSSLNSSTHSVATTSTNATATLATGTSANTTKNSSLLSAALVPSCSTAPPVFKFGSSVTATAISATSGIESTEAKTKDTSFGDLTSVPFGGASSAITSTENKVFGGTSPAVATTGSSLFGGTCSAIGSTGSSIFVGTSSAIGSTGSNIFGGTSPAITSTGGHLFGGTSSSTGSSVFGFTAAPISTTNQSWGTNPFMAGNAQASAAGSGVSTSTQSSPIQFGSSALAPSFGLAGNTASSSSNSFGSSTAGSKLFSSGATFGLSSSSSSGANNSISSGSSTTSSLFGSSWQAPKSPVFSSTFNCTSSSTGFSYGVSSVSGAAASNSAPMVFGSSAGASSSSIFPFNSDAAASPSQPVFGNPNPGFTFNSASTGSNDQMNMEDSMAEDMVQAATCTVPVFGQQHIAPPQSSFVFGAAPSSGSSPFQFGGQQNIAAPQNLSPVQASSSLEFNAGGGSFSLGSGGGDKSTRKFVKVKHKQRKK